LLIILLGKLSGSFIQAENNDFYFAGVFSQNISKFVVIISSFIGIIYLLSAGIYYSFKYLSELPEKSNSGNTGFRWARIIIIIFIPAFILSLSLGIIGFKYDMDYSFQDVPLVSALIVFIISYYYFSKKNPGLLSDPEKKEIPGLTNGIEPEYKKSGLDEKEAENILADLISYMEIEKPYLNEDLTIYDISKEMGIPRHHITQVINKRLRKNFYSFINEYRVEEFKNRLSEPENDNFKLMAIAYESGFKSKSGFYSAFRKIENMTPSEYKESALNNSR
jgi:AraC-like DNA-binding protein